MYNGADYLSIAIESVLAQSHPVAECIVVDDGSGDATPDIAQGFGSAVTYVRQPQRGGVSAARNRGASMATGDLVAFLDHDDAWVERKLERQLPAFADARVILSVCALQVVDADGAELDVKRLGTTDQLISGMLFFQERATLSCSSTGVTRRERFLELGGFDEQLSMSADWDLMMRILLEGGVSYVDEPLVRYRVHASNMSRQVSLMESDMSRAFAKAFAHPKMPRELQERQDEAYARLYRMLAGSYRGGGRAGAAARTFARAVRHNPRVAVELRRRPPLPYR